MRIQAFCMVILAYVVIGHPPPAVAQVDQQRAQEYFKEAQALCERDGGRLWGVSLCAPMVIADRRTQTFATSQPAPEGARPRVLGLVNAPVQWGGATWGAYMWDDVVNKTPRSRKELFLHELFHGVQPELGLGAPALATEHLDAADGRYWLRLEWRALARALRESGEPRNLAVREALAFRQARRMLYPASVEADLGHDGCGVRAQGRSGAHIRRAPSGTAQWRRRHSALTATFGSIGGFAADGSRDRISEMAFTTGC